MIDLGGASPLEDLLAGDSTKLSLLCSHLYSETLPCRAVAQGVSQRRGPRGTPSGALANLATRCKKGCQAKGHQKE